jgi:hypothetical protein
MAHFKDLLKQKFNESEDLANISKLDKSTVNSDYSEETDVIDVISKDEIFQILMELDPDEVSFIGQYIKMGLDDLEAIYNGDELDESFIVDDTDENTKEKKNFIDEFDASKLRKTQRLRRKSIDIKRIANNLRKKIGQRAQIRLKNLKAKRYGRQHKAQRKRYQRIRKVLKLNKTGYWAKNAKIKRIKKIIRGK